MTIEELGAQMKAKYPQYKDMDDRQLGERVVAKYPQYKSQVTTGGMRNWASNVPVLSQLQDAGIGIGSAVGKAVFGAEEAVSRGLGYASGKVGATGAQQSFNRFADVVRDTGDKIYTQPFESNLATTSGKVGTVVGNVAPFFMTSPTQGLTGLAKARALVMSSLADTGISLAQTGGNVGVGATTGITSLIANKLLPGAGAGIRQKIMSGVVPGYVSDVGMGLAGQRGENREGLGAFVPGAGTAFGAGIGLVQARGQIFNKQERVKTKRYNTLRLVQEGNRSLDRAVLAADKSGIDTKMFISESDLLVGAVDETGTVNSKAAVENLNDVLQPWENRVGDALEQEGLTVPADTLRQKMYQVVDDSRIIGDAKTQTRARIDREIAGLLQDFPDGNIPLRTVHDLKVQVNRTNAKSFIDPEKNQIGKTIGRALKEFVEDNTQALDVKTYNQELRKLYAVRDVLDALNGKKVEGGRLGKHFASVIGTMVGGQVGGPLGAIAGAEAGAKLKGISMKNALGGKGGTPVTIPQRMIDALKPQSNKSGSRNMIQSATMTPTTTDIAPNVPQNAQKTTPVSTRPVSQAKQHMQLLQDHIALQESILKENPASKLMRYVGKGNNSLSEVNYRAMGTDRKGAKLDDLVTELGYKDLDEAQAAIDDYVRTRDSIRSQKEELRKLRGEVRNGEDLISYDTPEYTSDAKMWETQLFAGGAAGFEMDDNGHVTFNPEKALLGMAAMAGAQKLPKAELLKRIRTSIPNRTKTEMADFVATIKSGAVKTDKDGFLQFATKADERAFEAGLALVNDRPMLRKFANDTLAKIANLYDEVLDYNKNM